MISFKNIPCDSPYRILKKKYDESLDANQKNIEAMCVASFSKNDNEVNARFVNLKYVYEKELIFFSNYKSPKAKDFISHSQVTALFYWNSINFQIRIKGKIKRKSKVFNDTYFSKRDIKKNALAISSNQSVPIQSYDDIVNNYNSILQKGNLTKCPEYWGGFSITPFYFEFWEGNPSRINKREVYELKNNEWIHSILQP